jgi:hypothetical protein
MNGTLQNENKLVGTLSSGSTMRGGLGTVIARDGKDGKDGKDGESIRNVSASISNYDGGENIVTFSDGTVLTVLNGSKGSPGSPGSPGATPVFTYSPTSEGTMVYVKSGNEITMFEVKNGSKGDKGDRGDRGEQGVSGVYVGSGDMPEGYNVQIDPSGEAFAPEDFISVEVDTTLTEEGKAADAKAVGDKFAEQSKAIETLEGIIHSEVGGLTAAQISALDGLFKIIAYTTDATTAYKAFTDAFGLTIDEGVSQIADTLIIVSGVTVSQSDTILSVA